MNKGVKGADLFRIWEKTVKKNDSCLTTPLQFIPRSKSTPNRLNVDDNFGNLTQIHMTRKNQIPIMSSLLSIKGLVQSKLGRSGLLLQ